MELKRNHSLLYAEWGRLNSRRNCYQRSKGKCSCMLSLSIMSIFCDPMDSSRLLCRWAFPGKNTGIGCHFFLQGSSQTRHQIHISCISCIGRCILYHWAIWKAQRARVWGSKEISLTRENDVVKNGWTGLSQQCTHACNRRDDRVHGHHDREWKDFVSPS